MSKGKALNEDYKSQLLNPRLPPSLHLLREENFAEHKGETIYEAFNFYAWDNRVFREVQKVSYLKTKLYRKAFTSLFPSSNRSSRSELQKRLLVTSWYKRPAIYFYPLRAALTRNLARMSE